MRIYWCTSYSYCCSERESGYFTALLRVGGGLVEEEELEEWTKQTGNEEVESLVEAFTKGGIKGLAEYEKGRKEEARKKIRWWQ